MANRHMKRCSMPLIIREMQVKPQWGISSHWSEGFSSINQQTMLVRMWKKGNGTLLHCWWECSAATVENSLEVPQKIKNGSALWPSDSTSGNISKESQNTNSKEHKHTYVQCSIIYKHQHIDAAQVSINRWVDKTTMGHLHNGILLDHKKEKPFYPLWQHGWTWRTLC